MKKGNSLTTSQITIKNIQHWFTTKISENNSVLLFKSDNNRPFIDKNRISLSKQANKYIKTKNSIFEDPETANYYEGFIYCWFLQESEETKYFLIREHTGYFDLTKPFGKLSKQITRFIENKKLLSDPCKDNIRKLCESIFSDNKWKKIRLSIIPKISAQVISFIGDNSVVFDRRLHEFDSIQFLNLKALEPFLNIVLRQETLVSFSLLTNYDGIFEHLDEIPLGNSIRRMLKSRMIEWFKKENIGQPEHIPLFSFEDESKLKLAVKEKTTTKNGKKYNVSLVKRSSKMEDMINEEARKVINGKDSSGLLYMMYKIKNSEIYPLYIGKAGKWGRGRNSNKISTNLQMRQDKTLSKSYMARWGNDYARNIGGLSAWIFERHKISKVDEKYNEWRKYLIKVTKKGNEITPYLKEPIYWWGKCWTGKDTDLFHRKGLSVEEMEMELIAYASMIFPDLLNKHNEGAHYFERKCF